MFNSHTIQKVNTNIQTFLSLFISKNFLSSILLLGPPTLSFPLPLYSLFLFPSHPYLSPNMARYLNSYTSSSFHPKLLHPPFLLPHLLIPTSNPYNFILLLIDFQSLVCASPFKLSHKYSQLFSRFCHQHRIICKKQNINIPFPLHISQPNTLPFSLHISNYTLHQYIK